MVSLYADDANGFQKKQIQMTLLQKYLVSFLTWSHKWEMKFNPAKCKVISISRKSHVPNLQFWLDNNFLHLIALMVKLILNTPRENNDIL